MCCTLADVDRDGRLDVVLRSGQIWPGDGAGGVAAVPVDAGVRIGAMADLNADGYLDIVATLVYGGGLMFRSGTAPVRAPHHDHDPRLRRPVFSLGDLNADGHLDAVLASGDMMLGNGDGTFIFGGRFDFGAPLYSSANNVLVAELSGDGLLDIVTGFHGVKCRV